MSAVAGDSRAPLEFNVRYLADAEELLARIEPGSVHTAFLDPQYTGVLEKLKFGSRSGRGHARRALPQMSDAQIHRIIAGIARSLRPSGHLFLWVDKFHLLEGVQAWYQGLPLSKVDLITWNKGRMGMGYRTRRTSEYLLVLQKLPKCAKGVWTLHNILDVWDERLPMPRVHCHAKPPGLITQLILATVPAGGLVLDPAAGSFVVRDVAVTHGRHFLGGDLAFGEATLE
jgi:site-specific DNA-methyltransferase (adenine-specific)